MQALSRFCVDGGQYFSKLQRTKIHSAGFEPRAISSSIEFTERLKQIWFHIKVLGHAISGEISPKNNFHRTKLETVTCWGKSSSLFELYFILSVFKLIAELHADVCGRRINKLTRKNGQNQVIILWLSPKPSVHSEEVGSFRV